MTEIKLVGDCFEFEIYEYDKFKETIKTKIADTRIKIAYNFFSLKDELIIETEQGLNYKTIIQQSEIGNWTQAEFKKVLGLYRETKLKAAWTADLERVIL